MKDVLFDVDGVLVHPWRFRDFLVREHGIGPELTREFFAGPFKKCALGQADVADELPPFLEQWGWTSGVSHFVECWLLEEDAPNQEVLAFAQGLRERGFRCHVASTQEPRRAQYLTDEMKFAQYFDALFFSCDIGAAKPDPVYFQETARILGLPPEELLLIDDSPANVESAQTQGWHAALFDGPGALKHISEMLCQFSADRKLAPDDPLRIPQVK